MWYNVSNIDTAMTLLRKKKNGLISPVASINRANESLVRLNLPAIPLEVVEDFDLRHEYSAYLAALIPLLKLKKLEAAEELAIALDGTIRSRSGVRQSLQGTGSETPL